MPNRLAHAQSPYLRQHADNPVDWYEWGEEAFAKARTENKPIFLSIGYSTCHWCHVMAHESFESAEIAALLNASFVAIKVDREERPDVDRVYMTYVQSMTGHGGWPLSAWLTPELKPFFGGTYFPPSDRGGRPGFPAILRAIVQGWSDPSSREKFTTEATRAVDALKEHAAGKNAAPGKTENTKATPDLLESAQAAFERAFVYFYENFDAEDGGFGGAPKFPRASVLGFLFRCAAIQGVASKSGEEAIGMATHTLQAMARGGLHDHVGGGFHRYSVDERWFVPHFEKMLYDQTQIAVNFLDARAVTGDERYGWLARDILDYLLRDMRHARGGFYSAEDADSLLAHGKPEHAEGAFYVWTAAELLAVLGSDDAALVVAHFGVEENGNVSAELDPHHEFSGKNILAQRQPLSATARAFDADPEALATRLHHALLRLREVRAKRPRPHLDDKLIAAWNGLAISALAKAHVGLERRTADSNLSFTGTATVGGGSERVYLDAARRAAEFVQSELYDATRGVLYRTYRTSRSATEGFAEDYAYLIEGLLDLYEASFEIRWLQWADALQQTMDRIFWDKTNGGYFSAAAGDPHLVLRLKEDYDGAEPAPSSVAASNLLRLATMLDTEAYRERALRTLEAFRSQWTQHPQALPQMLTAVELALDAPRHVVIAGSPSSADFQALLGAFPGPTGPRRSILAADGGEGQRWLAKRAPWIAEMKPANGRATAFVCERFTCQAPVDTPAELAALLRE